MPVSANTLFHFTKFRTLLDILYSKGFWPQYSLEHFENALPNSSAYFSAYIPMVCFCDLRLTQLSDTSISKHTDHYGKYGLGFKKNWGIRKKISPVSYVHEKSIASNTIDNIISTINASKIVSDKDLVSNLGEIVKFLKPYNGYYQRGEKQSEIITYYDEREWRYIPSSKKYEAFPVLHIKKRIIKTFNNELRNRSLTFSYKDIKYIVVDRDSDKKRFTKALFNRGFKDDDKAELLSKLVTFDEIRDDY